MSRYELLREQGLDTDDSELFEVGGVGMNFLDKLTESDHAGLRRPAAEADCNQQQQKSIPHIYTVPSTELATETFSKLQNSKAYPADNRLAHQQREVHEQLQNIENGDPNVPPPDPTTRSAVVALCSDSSTATGTSLQEQQQPQTQGGGRGRAGASPSGRLLGRTIEERSGRWRTVGCESYHRDNSIGALDNVNRNPIAPLSRAATCGQWAPAIQRGTPYREREPVPDHQSSQEPLSSRAGAQSQQNCQPQERQCCTHHSACAEVRRCHNFSKESSASREFQANAPITGAEMRSLPCAMHPTSDASYGGSFAQERGPSFHRSSSGREASGLQRSSSTRDTPWQRPEMPPENWRDHSASKSVHVSDRTNYHVSFSVTENHEVDTHKLRDKFREPMAPCKKVLQAKQHTTNQKPLRHNYEYPGVVEREKENICAGKAYTACGVKDGKDSSKGSSGCQHQYVRACSLRENGSTYAKIPRTYSVNAGGRQMECETCGKGGIGIVVLRLPGDDASFCKGCKSSSGSGWSCREGKPPKKKSIMDYCRKILRFPRKSG